MVAAAERSLQALTPAASLGARALRPLAAMAISDTKALATVAWPCGQRRAPQAGPPRCGGPWGGYFDAGGLRIARRVCGRFPAVPSWGLLGGKRQISPTKQCVEAVHITTLAARRASRTAPETAVVATILNRLCAAIDSVEDPCAKVRFVLAFLRFDICDARAHRMPETAGQAAWQAILLDRGWGGSALHQVCPSSLLGQSCPAVGRKLLFAGLRACSDLADLAQKTAAPQGLRGSLGE